MTEISGRRAGCGESRTSGSGEGTRKHARFAGAVRRVPIPHLEIVEAFFGGDKKMSSIRTPQVGKFFKSDTLLKLPTGRERAKPTLDKTVRAESLGWQYRARRSRLNRHLIPAIEDGAYWVWPCHRMFVVWAKDTGQLADLPLPKDTPMGQPGEGAGRA